MIVIKLAKLLESLGKTQNWLYQETGIRESTISDMCRNKSVMLSIVSLEKICKVLHCKVEDILEYIHE